MQIKEFEAYTLKECLQQVRDELGSDAVILETRKFRKGGLLGVGARDAVCIVAATGITVKDDVIGRKAANEGKGGTARSAQPAARGAEASGHGARSDRAVGSGNFKPVDKTPPGNAKPRDVHTTGQSAAVAAARLAYGRSASPSQRSDAADARSRTPVAIHNEIHSEIHNDQYGADQSRDVSDIPTAPPVFRRTVGPDTRKDTHEEADRFSQLERAMREIRDSLLALQREQKEGQERTVSAVVSAVAPALNGIGLAAVDPMAEMPPAIAELQSRLLRSGMSEALVQDLLDALPDLSAWSEPAREPLALSALRDLVGRRVCCGGPIILTPGRLKAVALIGPTGVGKTTTIAKLAAHFALVERKRVALLTVDTYRIAAVEQLKTYSQIIDIPISVAYNPSEVMPVIAQYADYDLLLIDTAGRSQKNIMQVGELKSLLELVNCETHLVLSASMKEQDMLEAARRFSAARVDRMIFSKLDETDTYGTLVAVGDGTGIPLSYLTNGQKVPEDIEVADAANLASMILDQPLN